MENLITLMVSKLDLADYILIAMLTIVAVSYWPRKRRKF